MTKEQWGDSEISKPEFKDAQDALQIYNHVMSNALIYGQGFLRFTSDGKCEVVDPKQYGELGAALTWTAENQVKL